MTWTRYVAVGDSFTEGLGDPDPERPGRWRGWADRVAATLAAGAPGGTGLRYANLAVRGRTFPQIVAEQVDRALELGPDLVSFHGGGNDLLRPSVDIDAMARRLEEVVSRFRGAGADVILFTGTDPAGAPVIRLTRGRVAVFNEHVRLIAARHGALLVDQWDMRVLRDWRMWAEDRLHMSAEGHRRVSLRVLEALGVPGAGDWREPLPPLPRPRPAVRLLSDARWAREHLVPWVGRRVRGRSSGDGLTGKRPELEPI
ncbi:MAG: SGNH/GDSL hydrolase family protein [Streptosporangiales bacterium]|nr:SGNH/GDSL hydrolase family protein [Streptosporangiales bacterium]